MGGINLTAYSQLFLQGGARADKITAWLHLFWVSHSILNGLAGNS